MSCEREDGPVKHYRLVCDTCKKQTKRFSWEPPYVGSKRWPAGWREIDWEKADLHGPRHECPTCGHAEVEKVKEIIPNDGNGFEMSDHEAVSCCLVRKEGNKLIVDLQEEGKLIITSNTRIVVEKHALGS